MKIKSFKKNRHLENFIQNLPITTFYIILASKKSWFKTSIQLFIFSENDIKIYLIKQWHSLIHLLGIKKDEENILFKNNIFYINFNSDPKNTIFNGENGYVVTALQNILMFYLEVKFQKKYKIIININNFIKI